jgi:hypothetical protein
MIRKSLLIGALLLTPVMTVSADQSNQSSESPTYQVKGDVSFYGSYESPNDHTPSKPVYQPNDKENPYYGDANTIASPSGVRPVLPNTGGQSDCQKLGLPITLVAIALLLAYWPKLIIAKFRLDKIVAKSLAK